MRPGGHVPSAFPGSQMPQSPTARYGQQQKEVWAAADQIARPLLDAEPNGELWRLSVIGDVLITVAWGTGARRVLELDAPLVADLPGYVSVIAAPRTSGGATAQVTLTRSSGAGPQEMRRAILVPGALHDDATRFVAFVASTVTIRGVGVVLAPGESIPLVSGSVLTAGSGFQEFTP